MGFDSEDERAAFYEQVRAAHAAAAQPLTADVFTAHGLPRRYFDMASSALNRVFKEHGEPSAPAIVSVRVRDPRETRPGETEMFVSVNIGEAVYEWADTYMVERANA